MEIFLFIYCLGFKDYLNSSEDAMTVWRGKKPNVSQCTTPGRWKASCPAVRDLGLLPFPLWGVHKQSTCPLFAENLNTVQMTEKKGLLVATPPAAEIPLKWTLRYFPACAVYDSKGDNRFGRRWLRSLRSALAASGDTSSAFSSAARFPFRFST